MAKYNVFQLDMWHDGNSWYENSRSPLYTENPFFNPDAQQMSIVIDDATLDSDILLREKLKSAYLVNSDDTDIETSWDGSEIVISVASDDDDDDKRPVIVLVAEDNE